MISEIRDYLRGGVQFVDSDLTENDSAFYDLDIGENLIDCSYQIEIQNILLQDRTEFRQQDITAQISIFGIGGIDEIEKYDSLLCKAICIRDYLISIKNFSNVGSIVNVISDGINCEQLTSDDNGFKIDINLTLSQAYSLEE